MNLEYIVNKIKNRNGEPLGIRDSYGIIVPLIKINNEINILFEIRSSNLKTQPGEISFPGGKVELGETYKDAAIRETCEELNILKENINFVGELDYIVMPFNISIYPFLAIIEGIKIENINYNSDEVEGIFAVPLTFFIKNEPVMNNLHINPEPDENFPYNLIKNGKAYNWRTGSYPVYFYKYEQNIIWGITARITKNFIDTIKK